MNFFAYLENMSDLAVMHAGENAPRAHFQPEGRSVLLNGEWAFEYFSSVHSLPVDFDAMTYPLENTIPVPSVWQSQGWDSFQYTNVRYPFPYDPPYVPAENPCGLYRRGFTLDKKPEKRYQLTFEGVDSCFFLWVNGCMAGFSQVSHSPAEFDITDVLRSGENTVAVLVMKWCFGSYLEDQDKFRYSGIFRDVMLTERDEIHIRDFFVRQEWQPDLSSVSLYVETEMSGGNAGVACTLYEPGGEKAACGSTENGVFACTVEQPEMWTAETPALYTLELRCGDERIVQRIGLRKIEIRRETVLLNGKKVRFRGVNLHESSCDTGAYTSPEHIRRDLLMMKQHNVNAVRTSHYPQPPLFYDLCDELGIYVLNEADLECHGVVTLSGPEHVREEYNRIADDPDFGDAILDRVQRMVYRDRNHACVLIYSMGNEAGCGVNFDRALAWTKAFDPSRLTHYERASFPPSGREINQTHLDLYSRMYPSIAEMKAYFREHTVRKPYILCEYCHAMGNGPGDLEDYEQLFMNESRICGGFVWEWTNHSPRVGRNAEDKDLFRYGGDFGEILHDGNFCADGLVNADRRPTPGLLELKNVMRPVRLLQVHEDCLTVQNRMDFLPLDSQVTLHLCYTKNGAVIRTVDVPREYLTIDPRKAGEIPYTPQTGCGCILEARLNRDTPWAPAGTVLGFDQVCVQNYEENGCEMGGPALSVSDDGGRFVSVCGGDFEYRFDKLKGMPVSLRRGGQELLQGPVRLNLWRAPTDNDRVIRREWECMQFRYADTRAMDWTESEAGKEVAFTAQLRVGAPSVRLLALGTVCWKISSGGRLSVRLSLTRGSGVTSFPRAGLCLSLPGKMRRLHYYAFGPGESYIDLHRSCRLDWFDSDVDSQYSHPLKPQEGGSHYGARSVTLQGEKLGLTVSGAPFSFSALPYSGEQLTDTPHDDELKEEDCVTLCVDAENAGIGSNSCGPALAEEYRVSNEVLLDISLIPFCK